MKPSHYLWCCFALVITANTAAQPASKAKSASEISIDESSFTSSHTPAAKDRPSSPTTRATNRPTNHSQPLNATTDLPMPGASSPEAQAETAAAKKIFLENLARMQPQLLEWRKATEDAVSENGLLPDFKSQGEIAARIRSFNDLAQQSQQMGQTISKGLEKIKSELREANISPQYATRFLATSKQEFDVLQQRLTKTNELCEQATKALKILSEEWGNWKYSPTEGLKAKAGFDDSRKNVYSEAVKNYVQLYRELKTLKSAE